MLFSLTDLPLPIGVLIPLFLDEEIRAPCPRKKSKIKQIHGGKNGKIS